MVSPAAVYLCHLTEALLLGRLEIAASFSYARSGEPAHNDLPA